MIRKFALFLIVILLTGCVRGAAPATPGESSSTGAPGAAEGNPAASVTSATGAASTSAGAVSPTTTRKNAGVPPAQLLPPVGTLLRFNITDGSGPVEEQFVRDGDRLIGTQNGKTYVTWITGPDGGIWRQDPKGGPNTPPLRYLPPVLEDGISWRQESGGEQVWFRLKYVESCGYAGGKELSGCWQLSVINRTDRTVFRFAPGYGPFDMNYRDFAHPKSDYSKTVFQWQKQDVSPEQRDRMLKEGTPLPAGDLLRATEVTAQEFDEAMRNAMHRAGRQFTELDLTGDGVPERFEGPVAAWTADPLQLATADGWPLAYYRSGGLQWVQFAKVKGFDFPVMLRGDESRLKGLVPGDPEAILPERSWSVAWFGGRFGEMAAGFAPKGGWVIGDTALLDGDGLMTVSWRMPDPAGHTWTRTYQMKVQNGQLWAVQESSSFKPTVSELVWPSTPEGLVTAAFIARWYDLQDELPRYFADPALAQSFAANKDVRTPAYHYGVARVGQVRPPAKQCDGPTVEPAPLAADGSIEFLIPVPEYESTTYYRGKVTVVHDGSGHLAIKALTFTRVSAGCM